jgi:hypothetical protein
LRKKALFCSRKRWSNGEPREADSTDGSTYLVGRSLSFILYLIETLLEEFLETFTLLFGGVIQWTPAKSISGEVESTLEVVV